MSRCIDKLIANKIESEGYYKDAYLNLKKTDSLNCINYDNKVNSLIVIQDSLKDLIQHKEIFYKKEIKNNNIKNGIILFVLIDFLGLIFYFYLEKKRAYLKLVSKNMEWANNQTNVSNIDLEEVIRSNNDFAEFDEKEKLILLQIIKLFNEDKIYLRNDITLNDISKQLNCNKATVSRLINLYFKKSLPSVLNEFRIKEAIRMLSEEHETLSYKLEAIGEICGFNNRQVFHSAFKKTTGLTPSDFRKMCQMKNFSEEVNV
ncbi:MAG: AraC family transcriptional regulator [Bacteroidales bacterium]|nr:AraC family transcriptional regulator [Bacteroidales bacterium]